MIAFGRRPAAVSGKHWNQGNIIPDDMRIGKLRKGCVGGHGESYPTAYLPDVKMKLNYIKTVTYVLCRVAAPSISGSGRRQKFDHGRRSSIHEVLCRFSTHGRANLLTSQAVQSTVCAFSIFGK